ncbi:MAG: glycosyltransferase family 2 protein [Halioglobus sp.]
MTRIGTDVAVLLCTFNGGRFLSSQLESLHRQVDVGIAIYASDDGSSDNTLEILGRSEPTRAPVFSRQGPGDGAAQNFLSLVGDNRISASYFAYADQDDVWDGDKLSRAVACLASCDALVPALYCARTRSLSEGGEIIGLSPKFSRTPSFANALVHNIGGGNTMVMNQAARELLLAAGRVDVPTHDWWTYLLVSGAGGVVVYDPEPCLSYRQHESNQIGANMGFKRRIARYLGAFGGRNREWSGRNIAALEKNAELLTSESREILRVFRKSRSGGVLQRINGVRKAGLYAQTVTGNLGLFFASLLKKI